MCGKGRDDRSSGFVEEVSIDVPVMKEVSR